MKKLTSFLLLFLIGLSLFSCDRKDNADAKDTLLVLHKTIKSGCFGDNAASLKLIGLSKDTVFFQAIQDTLIMNLGLNLNCCAKLVDSVVVKNNLITTFIKDTARIQCKCECYYKYGFRFIHYTPKTWMYDVKVKKYQDKDYSTVLKGAI